MRVKSEGEGEGERPRCRQPRRPSRRRPSRSRPSRCRRSHLRRSRHATPRRGRSRRYPRVAALACLHERVGHVAVRTCTWQGSRAGRRAARGACAPLHVEEELAVRRRQLEDDVVRRDRQECPSRFTTSFRQKCSAKAGLGLDHEHALEVLTHVRARSWDESP